jgi:hypothetical protein
MWLRRAEPVNLGLNQVLSGKGPALSGNLAQARPVSDDLALPMPLRNASCVAVVPLKSFVTAPNEDPALCRARRDPVRDCGVAHARPESGTSWSTDRYAG